MKEYKIPSIEEIRQISEQQKFNVVSLFAGVGGSSTGYRMAPPLQATLDMFTGTYSAADPGMLYDADIGAMYSSIPRTDYIMPSVSMIGWMFFTFLLLIIGIIIFQKREIK